MNRTQHNIHHFLQFMSNARQSIERNEFDMFYKSFMENCEESSLCFVCYRNLDLDHSFSKQTLHI